MRLLLVLIITILLCPYADAGGRGGHNTTFDPNLFGGNWACFRSLASGTCAGATAHYSNAACDGITDDSAALLDFVNYGHALNPALVKLYIPVGCKIHAVTQSSFVMDFSAHNVDNGIQNAIVWFYGGQIDNFFIGGFAYPNAIVGGIQQQALINTVSAGATTVTVNDGNVGVFSIGRWVAITGLCIQANQSGNPDQQYFEYKLITNISGNVLTFDSPLANSYKSTWPLLDLGDAGHQAQGGPALVYLLEPTWNTNLTIYGGTSTYTGQVNVVGKNLVTQDMTFGPNGFAPSSAKQIWMFGFNTNAIELDKNFELLTLYNGSVASQIIAQSAAGIMNVTGVSAAGIGAPTTTTITNSKFNTISPGPSCCGAGSSLVLDGVTFSSGFVIFHQQTISDYTFNSGTLTIAASSSVWKNSGTTFWVPGHKYYMGDIDGSNTCSSPTAFTASDVQVSGPNVNILTDIVAIPVTNICEGIRPPSTFGSYSVLSLTQKFTSGGGNLLNNPETLPP